MSPPNGPAGIPRLPILAFEIDLVGVVGGDGAPRTRIRPIRISRPSSTSTVRDDLKVGALLLEYSRQSKLLDRLETWLPLSRRGGHDVRSLFAFATCFLTAGPTSGIRPFISALDATSGRILAGIAGIPALPSSAAVSRALTGLTPSQVRACIDPLLVDDAGFARALANPNLVHRDARGQVLHVFDLDPTVSAFRQRELPGSDDMPAGERLAPGEPGYTGRKRGDVRIRNVPVMHAGSGLWMANRLVSQEGSLVSVEAELLARVKQVLPPSCRALMRADGEFGSVGAIGACLDAGFDVLTRFSRYKLLDSAESAEVLAGRDWYDVRDSLGKATRQAAELGTFRLPRENGGDVEVRVVAMRRPRTGKADHGVLRGGWQVELFATTISPEAWPPEDVVALYSGRSVLENRFAQEDREFGLGRTFSYKASGQEWMVGVGLYLWNALILRGLDVAPLPDTAPPSATAPRGSITGSEATGPREIPVAR